MGFKPSPNQQPTNSHPRMHARPYPKCSPGANVTYEHPLQSHPSLCTLMPHHSNLPNHPQPGYKKPKNTTRTPNASPESNAAESVIVYFPHQADLLLRKCELKKKQTIAQVEKLMPVAGGIQLRLPKTTGRLMRRQGLSAGRRRAMSQMRNGAMRPMGKAQMRGL